MSAAASPRLWTAASLAGLTLVLSSGNAEAHLITTGLGPVYDGVAHFVLSPEDLIPVIGLAVLAGLRGRAHGRWALFALPVFWLVGGAAGLLIARPPNNFAARHVIVAGRRPRGGGCAPGIMGDGCGRCDSCSGPRLCRRVRSPKRREWLSDGFGDEFSDFCDLRDSRSIPVAPAIPAGPNCHASLRQLDRRKRSFASRLVATQRTSIHFQLNRTESRPNFRVTHFATGYYFSYWELIA